MAKCWNFHSRAHWLLVFGSLNLNGFYRHPFWETKDAEVIRWIARKDCQASPVPDQRAQHIQPRFKYEPCPNKPKHFYTSRLSLTTSTYCVYNMVRSLLCRCWIIKFITWRFLLLTLICCFRWMWDIVLLPSEIIRCSSFLLGWLVFVDSVLFAPQSTGENPIVEMVCSATDDIVHGNVHITRSGEDPHRSRGSQIGDSPRQKIHKLYRIQ